MNFKRYHVSKNLFSEPLTNGYTLDGTTGLPSIYNKRCATLNPIDVSGLQNVTISFSSTLSRTRVIYSLFDNSTLIRRVTAIFSGDSIDVSDGNELYICFYDPGDIETVTKNDVTNIMLNTGSTALPYEPYSSEVWHDSHYIRVNGVWQSVASTHERSGGQWQ